MLSINVLPWAEKRMCMRYYTVVAILCGASLHQIQGHGSHHHASCYVSSDAKQKMSELNAARAVALLRESCRESGNDLHLISLQELKDMLHRAEHDILHMFEQMLGEGSYRIEVATEEDTHALSRYLVPLSQGHEVQLPYMIKQENGRFVVVPHGRTVIQHLRLLLLGALLDLLEKTEQEDDHSDRLEREGEYASQE